MCPHVAEPNVVFLPSEKFIAAFEITKRFVGEVVESLYLRTRSVPLLKPLSSVSFPQSSISLEKLASVRFEQNSGCFVLLLGRFK